MKPNRRFLLILLLSLSLISRAQKSNIVAFRSGTVQVYPNLRQSLTDSVSKQLKRTNGKAFFLISFDQLPTERERKILSASRIELQDYLPEKTYTATVTGDLVFTALEQAKVLAVSDLPAGLKMEQRMQASLLPAWSSRFAGTTDIWISVPKAFSLPEAETELRNLNVDILPSALRTARVLALRLATTRLKEIAAYPFVEYMQLAPRGDQTLNFNSMAASRSGVLSGSLATGGKNLHGEGVVVGIGDNADIQTHPDFAGRLIDRAAQPLTSGHGHHVSGTVGGAGNGESLYKGYATKATIISQGFNGVLTNATSYVNDYGMVITNNSYGDNIECDYFGTYDLYSRWLDQMAFDLPNLENIFSAGNSGGTICPPFSTDHHTVLGGYQSAKNVITVGATTDSGAIGNFSSRGPVRDGRVKPDITAMGQMVASTWSGAYYSYNSGTSMASPAVAGGAALLYQRYRQLNGGANPPNALMKAILCNGASDRGNTGPDFQYGYGWMNLLRSVDMIEASHYFSSSSTPASITTHTITVPANTAQLKVMLYWNDPAATPLSAKALVNDLDLEVVDPSSTVVLPKILDTANANLNLTSLNGADHVNNIEQVVINSPVAGTYTVRVKGTAIAQNPSQPYHVVYDPIPKQLKITSPAGGEPYFPSVIIYTTIKIAWEAYGYSSGTVDLDFSSDNGVTWTSIASGLDINRQLYTWWVPNVATKNALVRITNTTTGETTTCPPFAIMGQPLATLAATQCEGYINLDWTAVSGATDYEVMILRGDEMQPVATTTGTNYVFSGLSKDSLYWVTVRARIDGVPGRRAAALSRQPLNGSCSGTISDNDLKLDAILSPLSGRRFTSTQPSGAAVVRIRIKNLDDAAATGFTVKYSVNGGSYVTENLSSTTITASATYTHDFATTIDLSAPGAYSITTVVVNNTPDAVSSNDTLRYMVMHLDNQALNLATAFVETVEGATSSTYQKDTLGVAGVDRFDYKPSTLYGRLRTFVNSGIAYAGSKAFTLDADRYYPTGNTNYLTGTFNLSAYNTSTNDLRLDFQFNNHGQFPHSNNKVWIRGNDTQAWIPVYDLGAEQDDPGRYKRSESIELSDVLAANGQTLSTSMQVRWGQWGQIAATDKANAAGYSFDNIRVYQVFNDLQMRSIDEPAAASCALGTNTVIKVSVRNSANNLITSIPVRYRVNGGGWVTETIPSIAANTTVQYSFTTPANLSAFGDYTIQTVVDDASDSFRDNDTATATIVNLPVISSFPSLQNFESGNGYWFTGGKNSSWEYGTPQSAKINRAASGAKAWKTRLLGNYNDNEVSYLYSPCYDVSSLANPTLSFSLALDLEDCGNDLCDGTWVEYSSDGVNWTKLGAAGAGTNWYNKPADQLWSVQNYTNWHVATIPLPTGVSRLRLRFVVESDAAVNREGVGIDDVHIYDNVNGIYDGVSPSPPVTQTVSGNSWINFTSGGKLIASVHPNNQTMGATDVQAYIYQGPVRFTGTQYYHHRNITIKPANTLLSDSATVRFYFTDVETDTLIKATGCPGCAKPKTAYELGVSKYSDSDDNFENGTVADNMQGIWSYMNFPQLSIVPFDKGYYAEFKVKNFSEFWLNTGNFIIGTTLPVKLLDFTASKSGGDVVVKWNTESESNVDKYEIELAASEVLMNQNSYVKIGEVKSLGNSTAARVYQFTDNEANKTGLRYYRLKVINLDGSHYYSPVRPIQFEAPAVWQTYPNPTDDRFTLVFQGEVDEVVEMKLVDSKGSLIKSFSHKANGQVQKTTLSLKQYPSGLYILRVGQRSFRVYRK